MYLWERINPFGANYLSGYVSDIIAGKPGPNGNTLLAIKQDSTYPWRSLDGGKTWESLPTQGMDTSSGGKFYRITGTDTIIHHAINPFLAGSIFRTEDYGDTWEDVYAHGSGPLSYGCGGSFTSEICVASFENDLLRSTDAGRNWSVVKDFSGETGSPAPTCFLRLSDTDGLLGSEFEGQIWKTTDAGETWELQQDVQGTLGACRKFVQISDTVILIFGSGAKVMRSTDAGETWGGLVDLDDQFTFNGGNVGDGAHYWKQTGEVWCVTFNDPRLVVSYDEGLTWELLYNFEDLGYAYNDGIGGFTAIGGKTAVFGLNTNANSEYRFIRFYNSTFDETETAGAPVGTVNEGFGGFGFGGMGW